MEVTPVILTHFVPPDSSQDSQAMRYFTKRWDILQSTDYLSVINDYDYLVNTKAGLIAVTLKSRSL